MDKLYRTPLMTISSGLRVRIRTNSTFRVYRVWRSELEFLVHKFISKPINMSRSPAEDQHKKLLVTCRRPIISRADFPNRYKPGTRNAQLAASKIRNRNRRDNLQCPDIQRACLSSLRAKEGLEQN